MGLINRFSERLPVGEDTPRMSLGEGSTPLVHAPRLSKELGVELFLKCEGLNPTGSFKDRGMTVVVSKAVEEGATGVVCASTGNTAASAAAYAARAGLTAVVLCPAGAVTAAKSAQSRVAGARVLEVRGSFDDALRSCLELVEQGTFALVNSLNPYRIEGQKTAAFEIDEELGRAPDLLALPYGGGGNLVAYDKGFREDGASPALIAAQSDQRGTTLASAIRITEPAHADEVAEILEGGRAEVETVTDAEITAAWLDLASLEGIFCEPASAAGLAAVRKRTLEPGSTVVCVLTGHGLKDTPAVENALAEPATVVDATLDAILAEVAQVTPMSEIVVRAPATTANLGAGFDCAAAALDLWNELHVLSAADGDPLVVVEGEGADEVPHDEQHLALRAFALVAPLEGRSFRFINRIPFERGLGSSAATVAAGLVAGLAAAGQKASADHVLALGLPLEGHADNLAAAVRGGVCVIWQNGSGPHADRVATDLPLAPIVVVPNTRVNTEGSRSRLPETVSHADATAAAAQALLLGTAIASGDAHLLEQSFHDRLHEPYRMDDAPLLAELRANPVTGSHGVTLSGSGPSVVVWADKIELAVTVAALEARFPDARVLPLGIAQTGTEAI